MERDSRESGFVGQILTYLEEEGAVRCLETLEEFDETLQTLDLLASESERVHTQALLTLVRQVVEMIRLGPDILH